MVAVTDGVRVLEMPTQKEAQEYCAENINFKEVNVDDDQF